MKADLLDKVKRLQESSKARSGKQDRPRHYYEAIMLLPTREARKIALEQAPIEFRHIVRFYVESEFSKHNKKPLPTLEKP